MEPNKILIVEDELLIARDLSQKLKKQGFEVTGIVTSGQAALQAIATAPPDLILMDIVIKGNQDGISTAVSIRERYDIPVLFLTAYADDETLQRAESTGAYGYLLKPFNERELLTTIRMTLRKHQQFQRLEEQSTRDALTGLFNRRHVITILPRECGYSKQYSYPLSFILIDIDHFKDFNDSYGHDAGDYVLQLVSQLLQTSVRKTDLVCRYGGEEVLILLPKCPLDQAKSIAEGLRKKVSDLEPYYQGQFLRPLTISLGVASFPLHAQDGQSVIKAADTALYVAKSKGRNQVVIAPIPDSVVPIASS
jgi:diguanylate cyclase (GGDEF)-like protein